jgi:hypothetical protein
MARDYQEIDRVVQLCIEAIESSGESIDSVIARYPGLEEIIRPPLEAAIWLQARKSYFDPRPEFVSESRQRLIAQIQRGSEVQEQPRGLSLRDFFAVFARRQPVLQFAMALLLLVFLVVGTGSVALAARGALPGQSLYPVKLAQERLRLALSFTQAGDARLHAEFAQERLVEVQELVLERRYDLLVETLARYEQEVARAVFLAQEVAEDDAAPAARSQALALVNQMDENLTSQVVLLSVLSEHVPQETAAEINQALELAEQGIFTLEVIKNQLIVPETPTTTPTPTSSPTSTGTRVPTETPLPTQPSGSNASESPTATFEPAIVQTSLPGSTLVPTQVSQPNEPPTPTPTNTPKPTKVKPKPTNPNRPTARPTNPNRPTQKPDN